MEGDMTITSKIYTNVVEYKQKTGGYPDKIYIGMYKHQKLLSEVDRNRVPFDPFEKKFMNIPVIVVIEKDHLSFDASGVDKNQFVEAPLFLLR